MTTPSKTLRSILWIISKDVRRIKRENKDKLLSPETALTLARYASTLNSIVDEEEEAKKKARKTFEQMTTDELVRLYQQEQKRKQKDKAK